MSGDWEEDRFCRSLVVVFAVPEVMSCLHPRQRERRWNVMEELRNIICHNVPFVKKVNVISHADKCFPKKLFVQVLTFCGEYHLRRASSAVSISDGIGL